MRPRTRLLVLGLATIVIAAACRQYLPSNRYLRLRRTAESTSTADARAKFNHNAHAPVLAKTDTVCIDCHRFDVAIETGNEPLAQELSRKAQYPGGEPCHFCHVAQDTRMAKAPSACTTCHDNLLPLMPENHQVAWMKVHASVARADNTQCQSCHNQAFCIDCHQTRDTIQTRVHERNFRFIHSIQARANPMQCGSCHREDFCIRCHQQGKVDVNP